MFEDLFYDCTESEIQSVSRWSVSTINDTNRVDWYLPEFLQSKYSETCDFTKYMNKSWWTRINSISNLESDIYRIKNIFSTWRSQLIKHKHKLVYTIPNIIKPLSLDLSLYTTGTINISWVPFLMYERNNSLVMSHNLFNPFTVLLIRIINWIFLLV